MAKVAKRVKPSKQVKNKDTAADTHEAVLHPTSTGAEGTVCTKNKGTVPLNMGGEKPFLSELPTDRFTLDNWK